MSTFMLGFLTGSIITAAGLVFLAYRLGLITKKWG